MLHINSLLRSHLASLFLSLAIIVCFADAVRAQSALDGFDPNANGSVQVVVVQPDGKILIGGDFTIVQGISRNRIARLNIDGTLDQLFDPNSTGFVAVIALQTDGKILVGGGFNGLNSIGGQTRNRIARLDAITGQADSYNPNANGFVRSIAVQADGQIVAGGSFTTIGGQTRNRMARLDAVTGLADSFDPTVVGAGVNVIVVQPDGKILVGGTFSSIGGQPRSQIGRLDATSGLADSFNPNATVGSFLVAAIALQADGKVLAGGFFTTIGGQTRSNLARLDAVTGLADSFNPTSNNTVRSIAVQTDGRILAAGDFSTIGGQTRNRIARLDAASGLADLFDPNASAPSDVNAIAVQSDGKILAGGTFATLSPNGGAGVARNNIARLETDGGLDQTLNLSLDSSAHIYTIAVQPDGKILIGGSFTSVLGAGRNNIARVNTDGSLDTGFNPNANGIVYSLAVQANGQILVGGAFTSIGGQTRNRFARLDATTGAADAFNPNADNLVLTITVQQADSKILVGGSFTTIAGQTRNRIARLDQVSGAVDSFDPNASGVVNSIAVQPDGKILVGGYFINQFNPPTIGGQTRTSLARLDGATGLADSFNPNPNHEVHSILLQADNTILLGGYFFIVGGQTRIHFARVDGTTGLADSFDPSMGEGSVYSISAQSDGKILLAGFFETIGTGATRFDFARLDPVTAAADSLNPDLANGVHAIAVQADGKILIGGPFVILGGQLHPGFARLRHDTPALQNLAVTQNTITWTRGGSSTRLSRVTFESSTDNVNYSFLGHGTPTGANWSLTGLNLPTGQNLYIRARGHYRSGYQNGSESITESVRNAFISPSLTISGSVTYGNAIGSPAPPRFVKNVSVASTVGMPAVGPVITGTPGTYTLTGFGAGGYTMKPSKPGGATTAITSNDAARVAQGVTGSLPFVSQNQRFAADVTGNGVVSSQDAAKIAQFVAGLPFSPPNITGQWKFFVTGAPSPLPTPPQVYNDSRSYASVTTNLTGEDFVGILVGEVSGNWNPATHPRPVGSRQLAGGSEDIGATEKPITVAVQDVVTSAEKEIVVSVNVEGVAGKEIISYEFDLRYDPAVMQPLAEPVDVKGTVSRGLSVVVNPYEPGLLRVVVYGPMPIDENGVLLNLRFTAVGVPGSVSPLTFERIMFNEGETQMGLTDGRVGLSR